MSHEINSLLAKEFAELQLSDTDVILDVRTLDEWNEGHLTGAIHIDYFSDSFEDDITHLDKSKTYYVYCRSGKRSKDAIHVMHRQGFEHCINITDGILGLEKTSLTIER